MNNSIYYKNKFAHLDVFKYCYVTLIILFNINHLFAYIEVVKSIAI